jgi:hypothetical protein
MVFFSHWLDLTTKLISLTVIFGLTFSMGLPETLDGLFQQTPNPEFFTFLIFAALVVSYYFAFHRPIIEVLSSQIYARLRFGVNASWTEARLLRRLFSLNWQLQWKPMNQLHSLPREDRLKILLEAATR